METHAAGQEEKEKPPAKPHPSARLHLALAACALVALVLLVYYNSITNSFVWDDHEQIVMNPAIRPAAPLTRIFSSDVRFAHQDPAVQNQTYRPLQMLTYRIVGASFGFTPAPFHLTNLLLAIACVLAAFAVFWLLTRSTFSAFAAASLFAVYPIHTEAVDWIAALPDLGCTLFLLIALALFLAARRTEQPHRPAWLFPLLSLAAFAISLLWKETSAVFPILVVAYVLIVEKTGLRAALKASAAYWAILALYLIVRFSVLGGVATGARDWALGPLQLLLTTSHLMLSYWLKLAWPFQLNAYYVFSPVRSLTDPRAIAAIVFVLAAIAGLIYLVRRSPLPAFAALWVGITLLPAMDIYAVGRNVFAERYLYLPSIGFCLLLVLAATRLIHARAGKISQTRSYLASRHRSLRLFRRNHPAQPRLEGRQDALHPDPQPVAQRSIRPHHGSVHPERRIPRPTDAEQNYLQAIALAKQETPQDRPDLVAAYKGLASLYADRSDNQRALQMLASAREIAPADPEIDSEEGLVLVRAGRWSEAEPLLEKTIAANPENENVLSTLGIVAWQYHHDLTKAVEWFSKALAAHPEQDGFSASVHNNLGGVYGEQGDYVSSIAQYRLAVAISPQDPEYHTNLANALGAAKRYDEARSEAEAALQIAPDDPAARAVLQNLGIK